MKYLSVCSGIEAATVAWHPLGWEAVAFSEIEPFPNAVLAHHYPETPNWGDMEAFHEWPDADVDLLVGGTPCQSFSVAGLRKGLDDPRGNLALTYLAIAERYRPRWLVWENVSGVLSSDGGRAMGAFLGGLAKLGYGFAYRVLDAQYFGVAQRRRRVFVVGCLGDWRPAAAVLFEPESLRRNPAPSRGEGEGVAGDVARCFGGGRQSGASDVIAFHSRQDPDISNDVSHPVGAQDNGHAVAFAQNQRDEVRVMSVRRLTPRECERLQGFPDDYTLIRYRGKPAADGPRYKALGNSIAVPVLRWIGERVAMMEELLCEAAA